MNNHTHAETMEHPSRTGSFFSGFGSGLMSGALMMGLVFTLAATAALTGISGAAIPLVLGEHFLGFLGTASFMTVATGLFGGVMNVKRAIFDGAEQAANPQPSYVAIPTPGLNAPALAPVVALDRAEQPAPTQSWVAKTGRDAHAQSGNIQQILDNGALSDKDRASAILAERTAADTAQAR